MVEDPRENPHEGLGDLVEISKGKIAIFQLSIHKDVTYDPLHHSLDARRCRIGEGFGSGLYRIRQHHDSRLFGLRFGARIAIFLFPYLCQFGVLRIFCLLVEEGDQARTVVLLDDIDNRSGQFALPGQLHTILHMGSDNQVAHGRGELIVPIQGLHLVLDEISRLFDLSNIVIVGADANQEGISAYGLRGRLRQGAQNNTVVIGTGSHQDELSQDRLMQIGKLQQLEIGGDIKKGFQGRKQAQNKDADQEAVNSPTNEVVGKIRSPLVEERQDQDSRHIGNPDQPSCFEEGSSLFVLGQRGNPHHGARKRDQKEAKRVGGKERNQDNGSQRPSEGKARIEDYGEEGPADRHGQRILQGREGNRRKTGVNGMGQEQEETTDHGDKENNESNDPKVPGFSRLFRLPA